LWAILIYKYKNMQKENNTPLKKTISEKELETLKYWQDNKIFEKSIATPAGESPEGDYSFYDGPPFATGLPHHGHILAGTIKDAIPRFQTMNGKSVRRVWGWDCHGLPVENLIEKEVGLNSKKDIEEYGIGKFTRACFDSVLRYDKEWKEIVPRLGRWVDMSRAYKTMDWTYTESAWWAWGELYKKGLAYEGHKIMFVCTRCETSLAQSEVAGEYQDITDLTVTAKFKVLDSEEFKNTFILAWTTTPWTLPGNTALAVNRDIDYVKIKFSDSEDNFIVAKSRIDYAKKFKEVDHEIVEEFKGEKLIGLRYEAPFDYFNNEKYLSKLENAENIWKVWHADFITDDAGTGIAHEAPAFGAEDMQLAKENNIPIIKHVKMNGEFISEITDNNPDWKDVKVKKAGDSQSTDIEIVKWLAHNGKLFSKEKIIHSYPLCWRCKTPLLNYATSSWFIDVPKIKSKLISENKNIGWTPEHIRDGRFGKWLEGAREWAVSRSRYWGAPLPIWKSEKTGEIKVISSLEELAKESTNKPKNSYTLVRHGEANSNVAGILDIAGDAGNHLTPAGIAKAEQDKEKLANNFDIVFCSPLLRTQETAKIIADGKEVIVDDRLKESQLGSWDKKLVKDFQDWFTSSSAPYMERRPEGGETHREMMRRVASFMLECEEKYENKKIVIVTHAGPANMLLSWAHALSDTQIEANLFDLNSPYYLKPGEPKEVVWKKISYDENGDINLHRPYIDKIKVLDSEGHEMTRIIDVFDCWYESGSMPFASIHYPFEHKETFDNNFPAEFIAEGLDQTRGWFYSLINLGVGIFDKAPYKHVIVNGIINASDGQKMSKSLKNYTDPMEIVEKYGADALRFALLATPLVRGESVSFSDDYVDESSKKIIQRFENVFDFYKMYATGDVIEKSDSQNILDKWMLARVSETLQKVTIGFESYKLDEAARPLESLIDDLSTWYLRRSRDRLKADDNTEALATFKFILLEIVKMSAPIMPFMTERVYADLKQNKESVHLEKWSTFKFEDDEVLEKMKLVRDVVTSALLIRQNNNIKVRQPLASLTINLNLGEEYFSILKEELNVLDVKMDLEQKDLTVLDMQITPELKIAGEKREMLREIKDLRKEAGLTQEDFANLEIPEDKMYLVDEDFKKSARVKNITSGATLKVL